MEPGDPWLMGVVILLLFTSAFFSAAETALTKLNKVRLKTMVEENDPQAVVVERLLQRPGRLLGTILVGNNLVNILVTALGTALAIGYWGAEAGLRAAIAILTVLILVFGEITPKAFAASNPERVAKGVARPLTALVFILYPLAKVFTLIANGCILLFGGRVSQPESYLTEDELRTMVSVGQEEGLLESAEKEMIHNIFEFGDTFVRDVMVPRTDIISVASDISYQELGEVIKNQQFSRIPVYEGSIDNIVGIIYIKDLFILGPEQVASFQVTEQMREAYFVPEMKRIDGLFKEMREKKIHMAIVLDEYGGTAGVVTIEDLVEEIVGEIADEFDLEQSPLIEAVDEQTYILDAGLRIEDVNELLGINLPNQDIETIGGFALSLLERIPEAGEVIEWEGFEITILTMDGRRITRLRITRQEDWLSRTVTNNH